jgi:ribulose-5-phosphate 4-epimerase/fuculose-1-phosphate aldolase
MANDPEKQALAAALRLAAHFRLNEGICNHFSLQLPDGRFLLNPHAVHWSRVKASQILCVDPARPDDAAEVTALNIHGAVHRQHTAARCVLHTHMPFATALTCLQDGRLRFVHQNSLRFFDDVSYDPDYRGLAETKEEGERIASQMQGRRVLFLSNHGVIVCGRTVAEAFDKLYYLERACEVQVLAMSTGSTLREIDPGIAMQTRQEFDAGADYADAHFNALAALLAPDYRD